MAADEIHFEVFIRRTVASGWTLDSATEDRSEALELACALLSEHRVVAVRVTRETFDPVGGDYIGATILTKGDTEVRPRERDTVGDEALICRAARDLYTPHARKKIARLLKEWLRREQVTPFELLHDPELAGRLDASGLELQGAIQTVSIPEAKARRVSVHEVIRRYQKLAGDAIEQLAADGRRKTFPDLSVSSLAEAAAQALQTPDPAYVLGGCVAASLAASPGWKAKIQRLLDLADAAGDIEAERALAFTVLETVLVEVLGVRAGLVELFDTPRDLGDELLALTRLAVPAAGDDDMGAEGGGAEGGGAEGDSVIVRRLAKWLQHPAFAAVRSAIGRRILAELSGSRRLHPDDPEAEIAKVRMLALRLTAVASILPAEDVHEAFVKRSATLVTADFVQTFLSKVADSALTEAEALMRLAENVVGPANKRAAARWLRGAVAGVRFERELRTGPDTPALKLAHLAILQHHLLHVGLTEADSEEIAGKIGEVGGMVETNANLMAHIGHASAAPLHRMMLLLKLASGETAPRGPAAARARAEVARLVRLPELRTALTHAPELTVRIKALMAAAGLAA